MSIRESFVERFGEQDAVRIEEAALGHLTSFGTSHKEDEWGSDSFRYLLLAAIGYECVSKFRDSHGIQAAAEDIHGWALEHAHLHEHDGDIPDYLALYAGAYQPWINWDEAEPDSILGRYREYVVPDYVVDMFNAHDLNPPHTEGPS